MTESRPVSADDGKETTSLLDDPEAPGTREEEIIWRSRASGGRGGVLLPPPHGCKVVMPSLVLLVVLLAVMIGAVVVRRDHPSLQRHEQHGVLVSGTDTSCCSCLSISPTSTGTPSLTAIFLTRTSCK